ncbi:hypothetical protein [Nocardioides convexus]|nr:hypothetical protein [Nocardioides convexus]
MRACREPGRARPSLPYDVHGAVCLEDQAPGCTPSTCSPRS